MPKKQGKTIDPEAFRQFAAAAAKFR